MRWIVGILLFTILLFQNCAEVKLASLGMSASNQENNSPPENSDEPSATPTTLRTQNSGDWNNNQIADAPSLEELNSEIESSDQSGDFAIENSNKNTPPSPTYTPFVPLLKPTLPYESCQYYGLWRNGSSSPFTPVIHNQGAAFIAFKTGSDGQIFRIKIAQGSPEFSNSMGSAGVAADGPSFAVVSETPCDFNYDYVDNINSRYSAGTACGATAVYPRINTIVGADPEKIYGCVLQKNKIYYLNLRRESADPANRGKANFFGGAQFFGPTIQIDQVDD